MRVLITGNGGSGKTWLADRLSARLGSPVTHLDDVYWAGNYGGAGRDKAEVFHEVEQIAAGDAWVIEGVYGWLLPAALPRASEFVFLDLPVEECLANLKGRGKQGGGSDTAFEDMLRWVAEYPNRTNVHSRVHHRKLWDTFEGTKSRLDSRSDVDRYLDSRPRVPGIPPQSR